MAEERLFAGFDGGGTKTACALCSESGELLGLGAGGPSNYLYCGRELAAASVREALDSAFAAAGMERRALAAAYVASASIRMFNGAAHEPFFRSCIEAEEVICESDVYPIWYGAVRERPAVVSIVGTGAITYVCRRDRFTRVGGWGPLLGDEGSGYDIGLRALRLAARVSDGREPADESFLGAVLGRFGAGDTRGLVMELRSGDTRSRVAGTARLVVELAERGCAAAKGLLYDAAGEIALAAAAACERDGAEEPLPIILSGGLVGQDGALFELIGRRLPEFTKKISAVRAASPAPVISAAALALRGRGLNEAAERLLSRAGGEGS